MTPTKKTMKKGHNGTKAALPHKKQAATSPTEDDVVTIDRRGDDRRAKDRRQKSVPVAVEQRAMQRRTKVARRRQIDPTTCERDYSDDEVEFMNALDQYKRTSGRMFPTCSEVLEVIRNLGYQKQAQPMPVLPTVEPVETITQLETALASV